MSGFKILTIDDDRAVTSIFKRILERAPDLQVTEENLPERAFDTARNLRPHLILIDWNMPVVDGAELAARFVEDPDLRFVPLIFVTGYGDRARKFGFPVIEKPVGERTLRQAVDEELAKKGRTPASA